MAQNDPNKLIKITLTKRQWTVLFNLIVGQSYKFGIAIFLKDIVDAIEPHVLVDTNIPQPPVEENNAK